MESTRSLVRELSTRKRNAASCFFGGFSFDSSRTDGTAPTSTNIVRTSASKVLTPQDAPIVARKEEKAVARAKILVAFVLFLSALLVGVGIYMIGVEQDEMNFENLFEGYASEITTVSRQKVEQLFQSLDSFAFSITSQAESELRLTNQRWPFYSVPDWSQKAEKLVSISASKDPQVILAPVVQESDQGEWGSFMQQNMLPWVRESISNEDLVDDYTVFEILNRTAPFIYKLDAENAYEPTAINGTEGSLPIWQVYPFQSDPSIRYFSMGLDALSTEQIAGLYTVAKEVVGPTVGMTNLTLNSGVSIPGSHIIQPIYETTSRTTARQMVAAVIYRANWVGYFEDILDGGADGIILLLRFQCPNGDSSEVSIVRTHGSKSIVIGDVHDKRYDHLEYSETLVDINIDQSKIPDGTCVPKLSIHLYPTQAFYDSMETYMSPAEKASLILAVFGLPAIVFFLYDYLVARRQTKFMTRIALQEMIVSNVFPSAIRDRIYDEGGRRGKPEQDTTMDSFETEGIEGAPMAELFPSTTVVFADIAGFTAWASAREPQQVFILLESIFGAFDQIAAQNGVFKVETVGDCYVAAAGLPVMEEISEDFDHASAACLFANDCVRKMKEMTRRLEVTLGPDTTDLELRVGIHSGQVTAGVLRGERSRFQLFGDTMNTAARMESSGERNRIHLSQATVNLLENAGNSSWYISRGNKIFVKGKGNMQTYWLRRLAVQRSRSFDSSVGLSALLETSDRTEYAPDNSSKSIPMTIENVADSMTKTERLVEWNVEILTSLLQQIIASRSGEVKPIDSLVTKEQQMGSGVTILEEFVPIIPLKRFKARDLKRRRRAESVDIGTQAKTQLRNYLTTIAGMYKDNPFHNFEHASHVTASVKKLLKRIVKVDDGLGNSSHGGSLGGIERRGSMLGSSSHSAPLDLVDLAGHSYGITSDPMVQFAVVFSAIIHDVDHPGVPNTQLVKEETRSAQIYKKSIAEQNSVELSWDMLMGTEFSALRACIYQTEEELKRFRQLVVNTVMATDVVDKELQALRKSRWEKAFSETSNEEEDTTSSEDRKATIVIEHLIQASDVSHTMQHWHVYKRWNEKFFQECYGAFVQGRADTDPSIGWYKGEIGFFDFYVIPLAKKLDNCGVFGVSSHEYLNYAMANREEWVHEGEDLVKKWKAKCKGDTPFLFSQPSTRMVVC